MRLPCFFIIISLLLFSFACQNTSPDYNFGGANVTNYTESVQLNYARSLSFSIDSTFNIDRIRAIIPFQQAEGQAALAILNRRNIYLYNTAEATPYRIIKLQKEGPNGIGPMGSFDGLAVVAPDTFYFVSNSTSMMYRLNGSGELLQKEIIPIASEQSTVYGNVLNPLRTAGNQLIIPAYGFTAARDFTEIPTAYVYDVRTHAFQSTFHYPKLYNQAYWGYHTFMRWSAVTYNPATDEYYVSYAIDPNVYVYDNNFRLKAQKTLGSTHFTAIEPQHPNAQLRFDNGGISGENNQAYFMRTSYFAGAFYHSTLQYYMRICRIGKDENSGRGVQFSIIIADRNLNKVGEFLLPSHYVYETFFLTEDGIALLNMDKYDASENTIVFDVLSFSEM